MSIAPLHSRQGQHDETPTGENPPEDRALREATAPARASSGRYVRMAVRGGALAGGMIGAGFGPLAAASGMILGGAAGFFLETALEKKPRPRLS